jgi:ferredoxin
MEFDVVEWDEGARHSTVLETVVIPCDDVILAIGQENAYEWVERDLGIEFGEWEMPVLNEETLQSTLPHVFFGGDAAFGPKNIIWAVAHAHAAAISIHNFCQGVPVDERPQVSMTLVSQKMGMTEWSYHNEYNPSDRQQMNHVELTKRFAAIDLEVELGFDAEQTAREVQRCLNCDVQTAFKASLCIECDACIDICPVRCLTITSNGDEEDLRTRLSAPANNHDQAIWVSEPLPQTKRVMVKDENVCVHCGLCAQRCPTAAWDMEKFELDIPYAGNFNLLGKSPAVNVLSRS